MQEALHEGEDLRAPRRAELLAQIRDAQERRDEARRDYSDRVIDRADWLDIRQRTEGDISTARREYDRLTGSATVMSDIPPSERSALPWLIVLREQTRNDDVKVFSGRHVTSCWSVTWR